MRVHHGYSGDAHRPTFMQFVGAMCGLELIQLHSALLADSAMQCGVGLGATRAAQVPARWLRDDAKVEAAVVRAFLAAFPNCELRVRQRSTSISANNISASPERVSAVSDQQK